MTDALSYIGCTVPKLVCLPTVERDKAGLKRYRKFLTKETFSVSAKGHKKMVSLSEITFERIYSAVDAHWLKVYSHYVVPIRFSVCFI